MTSARRAHDAGHEGACGPVPVHKARPVSAGAQVRVRRFGVADLTARDLQAWTALEARAAEPNAYLSPHFVLPALRHLDPEVKPVLLAVEREGVGGNELIALGVFTSMAGSRLCPMPQLVGYLSRHSYLGGLLVDREHLDVAVGAFFDHLHAGLFGWQVLILPKVQSDGLVAQAFYTYAFGHGLHAHRAGVQERAVLLPAAAGQEALRQVLGKRYNEVERCKRRLSEFGDVDWQCLRERVSDVAIENFLQLEHQGWKAEVGSSLRATPADEAFFKETVARFGSESRALFTELRVGDKPIASTSNFISGGVGFAFKVGWEAELRKYGPGLLNEVEFMRAAPQVCADLGWFDSGAAPDSFINRLWTARRELATLVVPLTRLGEIGLNASASLRRAVRRLRKPVEETVESTQDMASSQTAEHSNYTHSR